MRGFCSHVARPPGHCPKPESPLVTWVPPGDAAVPPFSVQQVPPHASREDEYLGTKSKFWFYEADERRVLFKRGRDNEDWSEKVATEVAHRLGLPAAEVHLATSEGEFGITSPTFLKPGEQLFHGNELLQQVRPGYQSGRRYHVGEHTVPAVFEALRAAGALPNPSQPAPFEGFDVADQFVGYLLLDALVSNTDRHHENWAVLQSGTQRLLAPTYDHASSLGRNEPARRIEARLDGQDPRVTVQAYVHKGKSAFYSEATARRPLSPLAAFGQAAQLRPRGAEFWTGQLRGLSDSDFGALLQRVPSERISDLHRRFAATIMQCNRERIFRLQDELR